MLKSGYHSSLVQIPTLASQLKKVYPDKQKALCDKFTDLCKREKVAMQVLTQHEEKNQELRCKVNEVLEEQVSFPVHCTRTGRPRGSVH